MCVLAWLIIESPADDKRVGNFGYYVNVMLGGVAPRDCVSVFSEWFLRAFKNFLKKTKLSASILCSEAKWSKFEQG